MYEMVLSENVGLKEQLRDAQYYLSQANRELERVMKVRMLPAPLPLLPWSQSLVCMLVTRLSAVWSQT